MASGPKAYSQLDAIDPTAGLDGSEIFGVTKSGNTKRVTIKQVGIFARDVVNVMDFGAQNNYNRSNPTSGAALANLNANNAAFTAAWAKARSINGVLFIPAGDYALSTGILATDKADAGILGEKWRSTLFMFDGGVSGRIGIDIRQTFVDTQAVIARQPPIDGVTINGIWCTGAAIGLRCGPGLHGYVNVRVRGFQAIAGSPGVNGVTGAIGILFQNALMANGQTGVCEAFTLGHGMRIIECYQGIVYDRGVGHWSIGYQNHQHIVFRDCGTAVLITNGAWLYHCNVRWEFVVSDRGAAGALPWTNLIGVSVEAGATTTPVLGAGDPQPGSRLSGRVQIDFERNESSSDLWSTSCAPIHVDSDSMWKSEGWIDCLTACPKLPICTIGGVFFNRGSTFISPYPFPVWNTLMMFDGDLNTPLNRINNYRFEIKGNFTRVLQSGTILRWKDPNNGDYRYGRVDYSDYGTTTTDYTTVTLETLVSPDTLPLYMDAKTGDATVGHKRGSMEWFVYAPFDLPGDLLMGWKSLPVPLYESANSFSLPGDYTRVLIKGVKIKLKQGTYGFYYVLSSSLSGGRTTVTIIGGAALTNNPITAPSYSFETPPDFPQWFNYTPTYTGFGVGQSPNPGYRFRIDRTTCFIHAADTIGGSAGISTSGAFTASLPGTISAKGTGGPWTAPARVRNNGVIQATPGIAIILEGDNKISFGVGWDQAGGFNSAATIKNCLSCDISFEIA